MIECTIRLLSSIIIITIIFFLMIIIVTSTTIIIMIITNAKTESKTPPYAFLIARIAPVKERKISFDLFDLP